METEKTYYGEFNGNGYSIYCSETEQTQGAVYQAGNCKLDSAQYLPVGADGALDIVTIEEFCNSTGNDIAKENESIWQGCSRIDDNE